jgi:protein-L-isoaspartate(D-aspartate) O-methyltransferase
MVDALRCRGISDHPVLAAMATVPRERFVTPATRPDAYADAALDIGHGQTISEPYVVALMVEALQLEPTDRVLEIGTGSGYATAILAMLAARVYTVERISVLATSAQERLSVLGYRNVEVRCGDGARGWIDHTPYQAILCTAAGAAPPRSLLEQLDLGGRLVMPIDTVHGQTLIRVTRVHEDAYATTPLGLVHFVPLIAERRDA